MLSTEPNFTAAVVMVCGLLMLIAVVLSNTFGKRGVPLVLLFMLLGLAAGSEGLGGIEFDNYTFAFQLGNVALVLILFDGGLNTSVSSLRKVAKPAGLLATIGVMLTALIVSLAARALGFGWMESLLIGSVISSTDAAAVFSVLRTNAVALKDRVASTIEIESCMNDPMAVILTLSLTTAVASGEPPSWTMAGEIVVQLIIGILVGIAAGRFGQWIMKKPALTGALYPLLTVSTAMLAFGIATFTFGSGILAVFIAGMVMGDAKLPHHGSLVRIHDFIAWLAQVAMFTTLGLVAFPSQLVDAIVPGIVITLMLALVARPLTTALCLLPFRYAPKEILYIGWVGLRGSVPIVLATYPLMAGVEVGTEIFNIVFFVVVASVLIQGMSVGWVAQKLGLDTTSPPPSPVALELASAKIYADEIVTIYIDEDSPSLGKLIKDISFPDGSAAMLIVRGEHLIAPRGNSVVTQGDHISLFCRPEDTEAVYALFEVPDKYAV